MSNILHLIRLRHYRQLVFVKIEICPVYLITFDTFASINGFYCSGDHVCNGIRYKSLHREQTCGCQGEEGWERDGLGVWD